MYLSRVNVKSFDLVKFHRFHTLSTKANCRDALPQTGECRLTLYSDLDVILKKGKSPQGNRNRVKVK